MSVVKGNLYQGDSYAYYDAYNKYLALLEKVCYDTKGVGEEAFRVGDDVRRPVAPMWVGYSGGVCCGMSGTRHCFSRIAETGMVCSTSCCGSDKLLGNVAVGDAVVSRRGSEPRVDPLVDFDSSSKRSSSSSYVTSDRRCTDCYSLGAGYEVGRCEQESFGNSQATYTTSAKSNEARYSVKSGTSRIPVATKRNRTVRLGSCAGIRDSSELDTSVCESKTERNRRWRHEKKALKHRRQDRNEDWRKRSTQNGSNLRDSLERKWEFENELAAEKARRQLEVLKDSDIEIEKKKHRTKVSADTERNMAAIEKTHAYLAATGNVHRDDPGFCVTVLDGANSASITPDSSASMKEFRECQKALLDAQAKNEDYERKMQIIKERSGFPVDFIDMLDKQTWTVGSHNEEALDAIYPHGHAMDFFSTGVDNKFRVHGL